MTLHSRLSTLMGGKRFSIQKVHLQTNLSRTTVSNLYYDKATRIDFETIEKLCSLFDCELGELLFLENCNKGRDKNVK